MQNHFSNLDEMENKKTIFFFYKNAKEIIFSLLHFLKCNEENKSEKERKSYFPYVIYECSMCN